MRTYTQNNVPGNMHVVNESKLLSILGKNFTQILLMRDAYTIPEVIDQKPHLPTHLRNEGEGL